MRIREARVRDAEAISRMLPEDAAIGADALMGMISSGSKIYVATDFSANVLGCALDADRIYKSASCMDQGVEEELRKQYE